MKLFPPIKREVALMLPLIALVATVTVVANVTVGDDNWLRGGEDSPSDASNVVRQGPSLQPFVSTGNFRVEDKGIGVTVYKWNVEPEATTLLYSVDAATLSARIETVEVTLLDESGNHFETISNAVLETSLGVAGGILVTVPYRGGAQGMSLMVTSVTVSDDGHAEEVAGPWVIDFMRVSRPEPAPGYYAGVQVAPEVVTAGESKLSFESYQGGFFRLLIGRAESESVVHAHESEGSVGTLGEAEWHAKFQEVNGFADPGPVPGWDAADTSE